MPTLEKDMILCYELWKTRTYLSLNADECLMDNEDNHCDETEDMDLDQDEAEEEEYEEV